MSSDGVIKAALQHIGYLTLYFATGVVAGTLYETAINVRDTRIMVEKVELAMDRQEFLLIAMKNRMYKVLKPGEIEVCVNGKPLADELKDMVASAARVDTEPKPVADLRREPDGVSSVPLVFCVEPKNE
jgi:hypothetical protein